MKIFIIYLFKISEGTQNMRFIYGDYCWRLFIQTYPCSRLNKSGWKRFIFRKISFFQTFFFITYALYLKQVLVANFEPKVEVL